MVCIPLGVQDNLGGGEGGVCRRNSVKAGLIFIIIGILGVCRQVVNQEGSMQ